MATNNRQQQCISLNTLPFEVRSLIAENCPQADAFRLCLTCKALYDSSISRLYQCIIFDSSHRNFNKELSTKRLRPISDWPDPIWGNAKRYIEIIEDNTPNACDTIDHDMNSKAICDTSSKNQLLTSDIYFTDYRNFEQNITTSFNSYSSKNTTIQSLKVPKFSNSIITHQNQYIDKEDYASCFFSYTSVHTIGGIRRCMRTLTRDSPEKLKYIRRFEVLNHIDIPDYDIYEFLVAVLPGLTNLGVLVWRSFPLLSVDMLKLLQNNKKVIESSPGDDCEKFEMFSPIESLEINLRLDLHDATSMMSLAQLRFPWLHKLHLSPFISSDFLPLFASLITNTVETFNNLQWLQLSRDLGTSNHTGRYVANSGTNGNGFIGAPTGGSAGELIGGIGIRGNGRGGLINTYSPSSSSSRLFSFSSMDSHGVITPAGSGGPVGNSVGIVHNGEDNRINGRAFWNLNGDLDDKSISTFFGTLMKLRKEKLVSNTAMNEKNNTSGSIPSFLYCKEKLHLEYLGLSGIIVRGFSDFNIINEAVELSLVSRLELMGVDMYDRMVDGLPDLQNENGSSPNGNCSHSKCSNNPSGGFLPNLKTHLVKLQSLTLDWSENGGVDNVPEFLANLSRGLNCLKVVIRWNLCKSQTTTWGELCDRYVDSIAIRHAHSLENLVIDYGYDDTFGTEIRERRNNTDFVLGIGSSSSAVLPVTTTTNVRSVDGTIGNDRPSRSRNGPISSLDKLSVMGLRACTRLRGLSIAVPCETIDDLIPYLPRLTYLRVKNSTSKPYLGQNTSYLIEDWVRYNHIVERFWKLQSSENDFNEKKMLRFVRLEDYIFEIKKAKTANPLTGNSQAVSVVLRTGLADWFANKCEGE